MNRRRRIIWIRLIHEAESGQDAHFKAIGQPLDFIISISDFNMPEMDGIEHLRAVRGHQAIRPRPLMPMWTRCRNLQSSDCT